MKKLPVVTVRESRQGDFEKKCMFFVEKGYILISSSCGTVNDGDCYDEIWMAVFALPEIVNKSEHYKPNMGA